MKLKTGNKILVTLECIVVDDYEELTETSKHNEIKIFSTAFDETIIINWCKIKDKIFSFKDELKDLKITKIEKIE